MNNAKFAVDIDDPTVQRVMMLNLLRRIREIADAKHERKVCFPVALECEHVEPLSNDS